MHLDIVSVSVYECIPVEFLPPEEDESLTDHPRRHRSALPSFSQNSLALQRGLLVLDKTERAGDLLKIQQHRERGLTQNPARRSAPVRQSGQTVCALCV